MAKTLWFHCPGCRFNSWLENLRSCKPCSVAKKKKKKSYSTYHERILEDNLIERTEGWDPISIPFSYTIRWAESLEIQSLPSSLPVSFLFNTQVNLSMSMHTSEKEMATHSSVLAWRIPGTGEPGGLLSMGLHRVGHDWSVLEAAAVRQLSSVIPNCKKQRSPQSIKRLHRGTSLVVQ